jgi:hypothetical protein
MISCLCRASRRCRGSFMAGCRANPSIKGRDSVSEILNDQWGLSYPTAALSVRGWPQASLTMMRESSYLWELLTIEMYDFRESPALCLCAIACVRAFCL